VEPHGPGPCAKCGACCKVFVVEAYQADAEREPRIADECVRLDGNGTLPQEDWAWSIAVGHVQPCPFLRPDNLCDIHATKPDNCSCFEPGAAYCQEAQSLARDEDAKP
jgi:Fe-S-cluster containining protein